MRARPFAWPNPRVRSCSPDQGAGWTKTPLLHGARRRNGLGKPVRSARMGLVRTAEGIPRSPSAYYTRQVIAAGAFGSDQGFFDLRLPISACRLAFRIGKRWSAVRDRISRDAKVRETRTRRWDDLSNGHRLIRTSADERPLPKSSGTGHQCHHTPPSTSHLWTL